MDMAATLIVTAEISRNLPVEETTKALKYIWGLAYDYLDSDEKAENAMGDEKFQEFWLYKHAMCAQND